MGQDEDPGLEDELVLRDPDGGGHLAVRSLLGLADGPPAEDPAQGGSVLAVQIRHIDDAGLCSRTHSSPLASELQRTLPNVRRRNNHGIGADHRVATSWCPPG